MSESHVATHHELGFVRKYIFSTDHKVIGVQYMITAMFMAIIGGLLSMLMRYQLAWPQAFSPMMAKLSSPATVAAPGGVRVLPIFT